MSHANPYSSPSALPGNSYGGPQGPATRPGGLTAILVICLILGGMGMITICLQGLGLAMQAAASNLENNGGMPGDMDDNPEVEAAMKNLQQKQMIPNIVFLVFQLLLAPGLLIGAIGGLMQKGWGKGILSIVLPLSAAFVVCRSLVNAVFTLMFSGEVKDALVQSMKNQPDPNAVQMADTVGTAFQYTIYGAMAFGFLWAVGLAIFYVISWTRIRSEANARYFMS